MVVEGIEFLSLKEDEEIIRRLKESNLPIYIYGNGNNGIAVYRFMQINNIIIKAFVVDDGFYYCNSYMGISVKRLSKIAQSKKKFNLIIGFVDFALGISRAKKIENVNEIFCISNPYLYLKKYDLNKDFLMKNLLQFEQAYNLFEDDLSKRIMVAYINTRINKNYKFLMPYGGCKTYFNKEIVDLSKEEYFVDCGAYDGDSIKKFFAAVSGKYQKVYAFEPDRENYVRMKNEIEGLGENIHLFNIGLWDEKRMIKANKSGNQELEISTDAVCSDTIIEVDSLDNILKENKITFIKLSVQGAEEKAILGAKKILMRWNPTLAITIFMKPDALIKIPKLIKEINPKYKLFLRCEEPFFARVILYAKVIKSK